MDLMELMRIVSLCNLPNNPYQGATAFSAGGLNQGQSRIKLKLKF